MEYLLHEMESGRMGVMRTRRFIREGVPDPNDLTDVDTWILTKEEARFLVDELGKWL